MLSDIWTGIRGRFGIGAPTPPRVLRLTPSIEERIKQETPIPYRALTDGERERYLRLCNDIGSYEDAICRVWQTTTDKAKEVIKRVETHYILAGEMDSEKHEGSYIPVQTMVCSPQGPRSVEVGRVWLWQNEGFKSPPVKVRYHLGDRPQIDAALRFRGFLGLSGIDYGQTPSERRLRKRLTRTDAQLAQLQELIDAVKR